uniref:Uncharacterized protein n=1 Tax=Solanum lycopersicum TaxID=4081 RepID=A0A3Q7HMB4_SOLLC
MSMTKWKNDEIIFYEELLQTKLGSYGDKERGDIVFLMAIRVIIIFLLHRKIKKNLPLLFLMGPSRSRECHLGYVMHQSHFRDV